MRLLESHTVTTYEEKLSSNVRYAFEEADRFFNGCSLVQETLRRVAAEFDRLMLPYAVAGGMAMFHHGFERFTSNVDLVITRASLDRIGRDSEFLRLKPSVSNLRVMQDEATGVRIKF